MTCGLTITQEYRGQTSPEIGMAQTVPTWEEGVKSAEKPMQLTLI